MEYKYSQEKVWVGGMQSVFIMNPTPSSLFFSFFFFGGNAKNVGPF